MENMYLKILCFVLIKASFYIYYYYTCEKKKKCKEITKKNLT